jgi:hypothetical protein
VRFGRALAPVLLVGAAAIAAGCDGGSRGESTAGTATPPPIGGEPRPVPEPPALENATPEALAACGYGTGVLPAAGTPEATALEGCLRVLRGYPDPIRAPLELVSAELTTRA